MSKKVVEEQTKVRIRIKAYDNKIIDQSAKKIIETVERAGSQVSGPVPLPTAKHKMTVLSSSFVNKDARDQYEMKVHKRIIDIINPNPKTIEDLTTIDLPAGVGIEIKI